MAGRPTKYTPEIEIEVLQRLSAGESLRAICKSEHLPSDAAIRTWVIQDTPPGISTRYAHARALGLDSIAEETIEIADTCRIGEKRKVKSGGRSMTGEPLPDEEEIMTGDMVDRSRLQVDTRKWLLSKLAHKKYGDRIEIAGDADNPLNVNVTQSTELLAARIDSLITRSRTPELPEKSE